MTAGRTEMPIPATPDDIDARWLTDALQARYPGAQIIDVGVLDTNEVTNSHSKLRVISERDDLPERMFCKMAPIDPGRRDSILATGMGQREARFYGAVPPSLSMRVPKVYVAAEDVTDGSFVLLLEDLDGSGCTVSDGTTGVTPDAAAVALQDLAQLHLRYTSSDHRIEELGWVPTSRPLSDYATKLLRYGLAHNRERLSQPFARLTELYIDEAAALHDLWQQGPKTIVHGDTHIGNLFDDHGRTGFLDWGMINYTTPMRDVSFFMNMALATEDRRIHEQDLLRLYLEIWNAGSGLPLAFDQAWRAHRIHAAYCVPASCQIVTFPENATDRRRVFASAFLARAEAAIEDLEAFEAVSSAVGI
jgi:aminoglycoside phosphotransferase (APT) family kinase protein